MNFERKMSLISKTLKYNPEIHQIVTVGGGCFWGTEGLFRKHFLDNGKGLIDIKSGFANGKVANPTYKQVCQGNTDFVEVVQMSYDPSKVSSGDLYDFFFRIHDPTTENKQGHDVGTQYRSAIFYTSEEDKQAAELAKRKAESSDFFKGVPIVTRIEPLANYYDAEDYHQDYFEKHPEVPYCETHYVRGG